MESFYVMFPAIMYILHLEKHKMQKIKTIISTLKNRLIVIIYDLGIAESYFLPYFIKIAGST